MLSPVVSIVGVMFCLVDLSPGLLLVGWMGGIYIFCVLTYIFMYGRPAVVQPRGREHESIRIAGDSHADDTSK